GGALLLSGDDGDTNAADEDDGAGMQPAPTATAADTEPTEADDAAGPDDERPGAAPSPTNVVSEPTQPPTRTPEPEATATPTPTPTSTATATSTPTPEPSATPPAPGSYVVMDGDTCIGIAERQLLESGL